MLWPIWTACENADDIPDVTRGGVRHCAKNQHSPGSRIKSFDGCASAYHWVARREHKTVLREKVCQGRSVFISPGALVVCEHSRQFGRKSCGGDLRRLGCGRIVCESPDGDEASQQEYQDVSAVHIFRSLSRGRWRLPQ